MKFNKKLQYGLLLCFYLTRAGRATIPAISEELRLSKSLLEQVAAKLSGHGILHSIRGPGGGYELGNNINLMDLMEVLQPIPKENAIHLVSIEARTLHKMMTALNGELQLISLCYHLREYMQGVIDSEVELLNTLDKKGTLNQ